MANATTSHLPPLWRTLPTAAGNAVQIAGLVIGAAFTCVATVPNAPVVVRIVSMMAGWVALYLGSHAIAHWVVGRLVGIQFRGYGIRGSDHPEIYPPRIRAFMTHVPFFVALTSRQSMKRAAPAARAMMFGAGETSTTLWTLAAAWYVLHAGVPGGRTLLTFTVIWNLTAAVLTGRVPSGDYAKALRAYRG